MDSWRSPRLDALKQRLTLVTRQPSLVCPRTKNLRAVQWLLAFNQPESLNVWPILAADGEPYRIAPAVWPSSGETPRQLALDGAGIACLSDFMTGQDRASGRLVQILARHTQDMRRDVTPRAAPRRPRSGARATRAARRSTSRAATNTR